MAKMDHVTQIGNPEEGREVYFEDYAYTYLKKQENTDKKKYYLYGKKETENNCEKLYIYGISDSSKDESRYFKNWSSLGHLKIKNGEKFLMIKKGEEIHLTGFFVFYASNQGMQEYLIDNSKGIREEEKVIKKSIMQNRREESEREQKAEIPERNDTAGREREGFGRFVLSAGGLLILALSAIAVLSGNGYGQFTDLKQMVIQTMSDDAVIDDTEEFTVEERTEVGEYIGSTLLSGNETEFTEETEEVSDPGQKDISYQNEMPLKVDAPNQINIPAQNGDDAKREDSGADLEADVQTGGETGEEMDVGAEMNTAEIKSEGEEILSAPTLQEAGEEYESYVVKEGDTLLEICQEKYGGTERVREICEYNKIVNQDHIAPGQKLYLPK